MPDLSTPREHREYEEALAVPEDQRTDKQRKHIDWMEGRDVPGWPPRYYTGTNVNS